MDSEVYNYLKEISKYKPFTKEEEMEYFVKYLNKENVKDIIFNHYAGLVIPVVKSFLSKFNPQSLTIMDLINYGNLGLLNAIDKYDLSYNCRFSTIAVLYIKQTVFSSIQDYDLTIRIPIYKSKEIRNFYHQIKQLSLELNREPTNEEIANYINSDIDYVIKIKEAMQFLNLRSLNSCPKKLMDKDTEILYMIHDEKCNVEKEVVDKICYEQVDTILNKINLTENEKQTLLYRYDFFGYGKKKLEEISNILGVTKQRVNQLEVRAIKKIRNSPYIYELALYTSQPYEKLMSIGKTEGQIERNIEKIKKI